MARSHTVGLVFAAWRDMDDVLAGVTAAGAAARPDGGSSFAWTLAHVTNQLDAWINVRFQRRAPHSLVGADRFRMGGSGAAEDWPALRAGVAEVRAAARGYLAGLAEADLDRVVLYDGSFTALRERGLSLRHALLRIAAHHYVHIGEIAAERARRGERVGNFPGPMSECL